MQVQVGAMHRSLSSVGCVESGSSFRMTQLLLPAAADSAAAEQQHHDASLLQHQTPPRPPPARTSRTHARDSLPQTTLDARRRPPCSTPTSAADNLSRTPSPWQTSTLISLHDNVDYHRRLPPSHCSVYAADTSGQSSLKRRAICLFLCHARARKFVPTR